MGYIGENTIFSFRGGAVEVRPGTTLGAAGAAQFGRILAGQFRRISVGCAGFSHTHLLYALCSGIAESGRDVYVCENTDMPSFRFALKPLGADCGIYVVSGVKMALFRGNGFPMGTDEMSSLMNSKPAPPAKKCGKMSPVSSFRDIYVNNLVDSLNGGFKPVQAGVSCGDRAVRSLWGEFFTGGDDLVFQVSDGGCRVNAYSSLHGFISHERLIMAYSRLLALSGETLLLPEGLHYAADELVPGQKAPRFDIFGDIPEEAVRQRALADPLFMCVQLTADMHRSNSILRDLPQAATVRREVVVGSAGKVPCGEEFRTQTGRIRLTRSGRDRITLAAQSFSSETASELCAEWTEKIRRMFP
ncbi:MAG: hypothetical protein IJM44_04335 [Ruminococcus sp.]|nr:hypothetical protein [Ruminococcus sp.]